MPSSLSSSWQDHLNKTMKKNPEKSPQECMQLASKSYKKSSSSTHPPTLSKTNHTPAKGPISSKTPESSSSPKEVLLNMSSSIIDLLRLSTNVFEDKDVKSLMSCEKKLCYLVDQYVPDSESESGDYDSEDEV